MKLAIALIVAALLQVHTALYAQNITLSKHDISLSQLFKEIKKQTGYDFLYNPEMLKKARPISLDVTKASLTAVLETSFAGQPLTYTIDQKTIIVKEKPAISDIVKAVAIVPLTITGKVYSYMDKKPIANASVFLSNALVGGKTGDDGVFSLQNVRSGRYQLVVSAVGFETYRQTIMAYNRDLVLPSIILNPQIINLNEVSIKPKADHYRGRNLEWFTREFLGTSYLGKLCTIVNPEVIDLDYDDTTNVLTGSSYDFIVIRNSALGYKIKFLLNDFTYDNKEVSRQKIHYEGFASFEALKGSPSQEKRWQKARQEVYEGSIMHFLRSLLSNRIDEEGFKVFQLVNDSDSTKPKSSKMISKLIRVPLEKDDIIKSTNEEGIYAFGSKETELFIAYAKNHHFHIRDNLDFLDMDNNTESTLVSFNSPHTFFDNNGYVLNPNSIIYKGVWSRDRMGSLLPVDYEPPINDKAKDSYIINNRIQATQPGQLKNNLLKITGRADSLVKNYPAEKLYLQFDKPYYAVGDTLWFKAWLFHAPTLAFSAKSSILYVDIANDSNKVVKQYKMPLQDGISQGNLSLDSIDFKTGTYTIRAYTNWMRNFGDDCFFHKQFDITGNTGNTWLVNSLSKTSVQNDHYAVNAQMQFTDINKAPIANNAVQLQVLEGDKRLYRQKLITDPNGLLKVDFTLPKQGQPIAIVVKDDKGNKNAVIPLNLNRVEKADIQFLPEGGNMIAGLTAHVAFKAIGEDGKGINVSGIIIDRAGSQVATFQSLHKGMGSFDLSAKNDESYTAKVTLPGGTVKEYPLPAVKNTGIAFQLKNAMKSDSVEVALAATIDIVQSNQCYFLIGKARGIICYAGIVEFHDNSNIYRSIPKSLFPSGVTHFILMTTAGLPLNERCVFIDHHDDLRIRIMADKPAYAPRGSIGLRLKVTDSNGKPVEGNFTLAATDNAQVTADSLNSGNMISHILLASDIKGYIEDPGYYTQAKNAQSWQALDNMMLTQGWVSYDWPEDKQAPAFTAEDGLTVKGQVLNGFNKPISATKVQLFLKSPLIVKDTLTDKDGRFAFNAFPRIDTPVFLISTVNRKSNVGIKMDETPAPVFNTTYPIATPWYVNSDTGIIRYTRTRDSINKMPDYLPDGSHSLREVKILAKKIVKKSQNLNGSGNADIVLDEKDIEKAAKKSWLQVIRERVKNFREGKYGFYFIEDEPVFLVIDGQLYRPTGVQTLQDYIDDIAHYLQYHNAEEITGMEVNITTRYEGKYMQRFFPMLIDKYFAFIEITTRAGQGPIIETYPNNNIYKPLAISYPKQFYKPKYPVNDKSKHQPDLRSTIDWEPNIFTDKNGEATVHFYAADNPSIYTIIVEGTDGDGNLGYKSKTILLNKPKSLVSK